MLTQLRRSSIRMPDTIRPGASFQSRSSPTGPMCLARTQRSRQHTAGTDRIREKANPGKLNIGPAGQPASCAGPCSDKNGRRFTTFHIARRRSFCRIFWPVSVQLYFNAGEPLASMRFARQIKAYASTSANARTSGLPNVPTMAEAGLPTIRVIGATGRAFWRRPKRGRNSLQS